MAHNPKMSLFFALQDLSYHKKGLYRRCNVLEWNRVKAKTKVSSFSTGSPNVPPNVTTGYACTGHIHIRECVFCRNEIDRHEVHYSCPDWVNRIRGRVFVPNPWCQVVSNWVVRLACCFPLSGFNQEQPAQQQIAVAFVQHVQLVLGVMVLTKRKVSFHGYAQTVQR